MVRPNGKRIKTLRIAKGWSQAELADRARVGERTVQRAERGDSARPNTVASLASGLGIEVSEIMEMSVSKAPSVGLPVNARPRRLGRYGPLLAAVCDAANAVFHWRRHFADTFEYRSFFLREPQPTLFAQLEAVAPVAATVSLSLHKDVAEAVKALKQMHREIQGIGASLRNSANTGYRLSPAARLAVQKSGAYTCDYAQFHLRRAVAELCASLGLESSTLPLLEA